MLEGHPSRVMYHQVYQYTKIRLAGHPSAAHSSTAFRWTGVVYLLDVKRFRGGIVFKAYRLLYHSTLGVRVIKKKKKYTFWMPAPAWSLWNLVSLIQSSHVERLLWGSGFRV